MKLLLHLIISVFVFSFTLNFVAFSQSSTLTAEVKDTSVVFSGYTAPNSQISIIENNIVIGTTSSDINGYFSKGVNVDTGIHIMQLTSNDLSSGKMPSIEFNLILIAHQELNIARILMPSSLLVSANEYLLSDDIIISGYAKPNSQIELSLIGLDTSIHNLTSNAFGYFELSIKGNTLKPGLYRIKSQILVNEIIDNPTINTADGFLLNDDTNEKPVPTNIPINNKCAVRYIRVCYFASFSQEAFITREEFLIYLNGFIVQKDKSLNNIYDINENGVIELSDLSIILYYWDDKANLVKGFATEVTRSEPYNKYNVTTSSENNTNIFVNSLLVELIILILSMIFFLILFIFRKKKEEDSED